MKKGHDEKAARERSETRDKAWFKEAIKLLEKSDFKTILDVGAGKGEFLEIILEKNKDAERWGVDYAPTNLKIMQKKGIKTSDIDLESIDFNKIKHLKGKFDVVVCLEVVEHIFNTDSIFQLFNFVLKKGGKLIISTPNTGSWQYKLFYLSNGYPHGEGHHVRFFTKKKLYRAAKFNGFNLSKYSNYFRAGTNIMKRILGTENKVLVKTFSAILFGPCYIFSRLGIFNSWSNYGLVASFVKNGLSPLGTEHKILEKRFKALEKRESNAWKKSLRKYLKKDHLRDTVYLRKSVREIIDD